MQGIGFENELEAGETERGLCNISGDPTAAAGSPRDPAGWPGSCPAPCLFFLSFCCLSLLVPPFFLLHPVSSQSDALIVAF